MLIFTNLTVMWYSYLCVYMCVCVWYLYCLWYGELLVSVGFFKYGKILAIISLHCLSSPTLLSATEMSIICLLNCLKLPMCQWRSVHYFFQSLFLYASVWMECEVKWTLESITMNKASGGDGIPVELFQILKDDAVKVLHSICQQIWKTQHWPQDWKRSVFIPISKKDNAKVPHNCTHLTRARFNTKVLFTLMP